MIKNKIEIDGDIATIHIVRRNGDKYVTSIDVEELSKLEDWNTVYAGAHDKQFCAVVQRDNGLRREGNSIYLHRLITNAPEGLVVDHINGNPLDNRKSNLRIITNAENGQNLKGPQSRSTTGIRGVYYSHRDNKYTTQVTIEGVRHYLGMYSTPEQAEKAVKNFRSKHMPFSTMDKEVV